MASEDGSSTSEQGIIEEPKPAGPGLAAMLALAKLDVDRGLLRSGEGLSDGYVMFSPLLSNTTYLIDRAGQVVHTWGGELGAGIEYLLDDGYLLRAARIPDAPRFFGGGQNGRIEKLDWEGNVVWRFDHVSEASLLHHDIAPLPNGNILALAWEHKTRDEAAAAGRLPEMTPEGGLWPDVVFEIRPNADGGDIVWEWHSWDHMIQFVDPDKPNYGDPAQHPGRIDLNAGHPPPDVDEARLAHQKRIGLAPTAATVASMGADIHHSNAIDYNPDLDQIAISTRSLSEVWIIDHAVSTTEARGEPGNLLYRWGNSSNYGCRSDDHHGLGHQHDVRWIPDGYPGAGNLMIFSNDGHGMTPPQTEVVELETPMKGKRYISSRRKPFGPEQPIWRWNDPAYYSPFISGASRLRNGNTLVNFGPQGRFVEVSPAGEIVWEYLTPFAGDARLPDGTWPQPAMPFYFAVFRTTFIPADHPALVGKSLGPTQPQPAPYVIDQNEMAPFMEAVAAEATARGRMMD